MKEVSRHKNITLENRTCTKNVDVIALRSIWLCYSTVVRTNIRQHYLSHMQITNNLKDKSEAFKLINTDEDVSRGVVAPVYQGGQGPEISEK